MHTGDRTNTRTAAIAAAATPSSISSPQELVKIRQQFNEIRTLCEQAITSAPHHVQLTNIIIKILARLQNVETIKKSIQDRNLQMHAARRRTLDAIPSKFGPTAPALAAAHSPHNTGGTSIIGRPFDSLANFLQLMKRRPVSANSNHQHHHQPSTALCPKRCTALSVTTTATAATPTTSSAPPQPPAVSDRFNDSLWFLAHDHSKHSQWEWQKKTPLNGLRPAPPQWLDVGKKGRRSLPVFNILDEILQEDIEPLRSEYPRKDHIGVPPRKRSASTTTPPPPSTQVAAHQVGEPALHSTTTTPPATPITAATNTITYLHSLMHELSVSNSEEVWQRLFAPPSQQQPIIVMPLKVTYETPTRDEGHVGIGAGAVTIKPIKVDITAATGGAHHTKQPRPNSHPLSHTNKPKDKLMLDHLHGLKAKNDVIQKNIQHAIDVIETKMIDIISRDAPDQNATVGQKLIADVPVASAPPSPTLAPPTKRSHHSKGGSSTSTTKAAGAPATVAATGMSSAAFNAMEMEINKVLKMINVAQQPTSNSTGGASPAPSPKRLSNLSGTGSQPLHGVQAAEREQSPPRNAARHVVATPPAPSSTVRIHKKMVVSKGGTGSVQTSVSQPVAGGRSPTTTARKSVHDQQRRNKQQQQPPTSMPTSPSPPPPPQPTAPLQPQPITVYQAPPTYRFTPIDMIESEQLSREIVQIHHKIDEFCTNIRSKHSVNEDAPADGMGSMESPLSQARSITIDEGVEPPASESDFFSMLESFNAIVSAKSSTLETRANQGVLVEHASEGDVNMTYNNEEIGASSNSTNILEFLDQLSDIGGGENDQQGDTGLASCTDHMREASEARKKIRFFENLSQAAGRGGDGGDVGVDPLDVDFDEDDSDQECQQHDSVEIGEVDNTDEALSDNLTQPVVVYGDVAAHVLPPVVDHANYVVQSVVVHSSQHILTLPSSEQQQNNNNSTADGRGRCSADSTTANEE